VAGVASEIRNNIYITNNKKQTGENWGIGKRLLKPKTFNFFNGERGMSVDGGVSEN
jgi:hypothetical protein